MEGTAALRAGILEGPQNNALQLTSLRRRRSATSQLNAVFDGLGGRVGVDLRWRDESELEAIEDPKMLLSSHVQSREWRDTSCLRFIDPWGDAVFNQLQIPVLIQELESSLAEARDVNVREHVDRVIGVLRHAINKTHTYAWFVGD